MPIYRLTVKDNWISRTRQDDQCFIEFHDDAKRCHSGIDKTTKTRWQTDQAQPHKSLGLILIPWRIPKDINAVRAELTDLIVYSP